MNREVICRPFPPELIKQRRGQGGKKLSYLETHAVISRLNFELSRLAATKPEVLRALARIHAEELARHDKQAAKKSGETGKLHAGAVTFV